MNVELTADAVAQLDKLPSSIIGRVGHVVERLRDWPNVSGVKPLTESMPAAFASAPATTESFSECKDSGLSSGASPTAVTPMRTDRGQHTRNESRR